MPEKMEAAAPQGSEKARFDEISLLRTLCLLLVIFLHAAMPFKIPFLFWKNYADAPSMLAQHILVFSGFLVIPSLVFCSGFVFAFGVNIKKTAFVPMLKNRFFRLLVPWFLVAVFWMAPLYCLFDIEALNRPAGTSFYETLLAAASGMFCDHLWFLPVLFWTSLFWMVFMPLARRLGALSGIVLAIAAGLLMHYQGRSLTWFCLWETTGTLLYFYLGAQALEYRERLKRIPAAVFPAVFAFLLFIAVYVPVLAHHELASWLLGGLGATAAWCLCVRLSPRIYPFIRQSAAFRFFEQYAFRYYLFHLPPGLLIFRWLYSRADLPAPVFVMLSFVLNLGVTTLLVVLFNRFERIFRDKFR